MSQSNPLLKTLFIGGVVAYIGSMFPLLDGNEWEWRGICMIAAFLFAGPLFLLNIIFSCVRYQTLDKLDKGFCGLSVLFLFLIALGLYFGNL